MRYFIRVCKLVLALLILFQPVFSQAPIQIHKLNEAIVFDGIPNEQEWSQAAPFPMIMHVPTYGLTPGQETDIRMMYDDSYFYIGASMFVEEPEMIMAYGKKRDLNSPSCDWLGISLDTYNDKENSLLFFTNPNGVRYDATISNDADAGDILPLNLNWNTFWVVKTVVKDLVWHAEFKIPISSLRFRAADENVTMGISFYRYLPKLNEGYIYPSIPYDWADYSKFKPSQFAEVTFRGIKPKKPLYISPYILGGFTQTNTLNTAETAYDYQMDPKLEPGIDVKYGISTNTTLDLTVNTDFAQVEADDQQFNISRFSLIFPEKRTFFLERASIFDFSFAGGNSLFYSRKIGLYNGSPVRIVGGARLVSKVNDWDIGVMDMQTSEFMDLPSENFGVFRVKRKVFNQYSYAGGMLTSRIGMDGSYNLAYGIDGIFKVFDNEYLTIRWAQTFEDEVEIKPFSLKPSRYLIIWERRRQNGFSYQLAHNYSGVAFNPGIGLERFQDYYLFRGIFNYTWLSPAKSVLQSHTLSINATQANDVTDNHPLFTVITPSWTFISKNSWSGLFYLSYNHQFLDYDFTITDEVYIPAGSYKYVSGNFTVNTPYSKPYYANLTLSGGQYFDGINFSPKIEPAINIGASLELGGIYRYDFVRIAERDQVLNNHIFGIRGLYMISTKFSISAFVQYNTAIDKVLSNIRFRYNPKEGTDLYIVFNEGRNTYLERTLPNLPIYDSRSVMLKFTYTFDL
ncbi:DUF5916 domain-containing protein [Bacteroidota bacterium]